MHPHARKSREVHKQNPTPPKEYIPKTLAGDTWASLAGLKRGLDLQMQEENAAPALAHSRNAGDEITALRCGAGFLI